MEKDAILELIRKKAQNLELDSLQGIADALLQIYNKNEQGKQPLPPAPPGKDPIEIDPDLPQLKRDSNSNNNNSDFDDPDDVLSKITYLDDADEDADDDTSNSNSNESGSDSGTDSDGSDNQANSKSSQQRDDNSGTDSNQSSSNVDKQTQHGGDDTNDTKDKTNAKGAADEQSDQINQDEQDEQDDVDTNSSDYKTRKSIYDRVKSVLNKAISKANKKGASQEIMDALEDAKEELERITDSDLAYGSDQLDNAIDNAVDAISKVMPVQKTSDTAPTQASIKKVFDDIETKIEIDNEDRSNIDPNFAIKAREKEINKWSANVVNSEADLKNDLRTCIKSQIDYHKQQVKTWQRINRHHETDNIVAKGTMKKTALTTNTITLDVYLDQSGSWEGFAPKIKNMLAILNDFTKPDPLNDNKPWLKINLYYFDDDIYTAIPSVQGSTDAWPKIYENIQKSNPTNVMIITDRDLYNQRNCSRIWSDSKAPIYVRGSVFWVWRGNDTSAGLMKYLVGFKGNHQYSI